MMNTNHPDDELLAAFAGADPDATGDPALSEHLASCDRCTTTVADLRSLSNALGALPDLAPHRPLRFLPPVDEPRPTFADRLGGVVRGIFAPALTAGAALVLVGAVGTFGPSMEALSGGGDAAAPQEGAAMEAAESAAAAPGGEAAEDQGRATATAEERGAVGHDGADASSGATPLTLGEAQQSEAAPDDDLDAFAPTSEDGGAGDAGLSTERPIWPMLLFAGVALIVLMVMLRWILAPRAA
jgi:hypothetical protein